MARLSAAAAVGALITFLIVVPDEGGSRVAATRSTAPATATSVQAVMPARQGVTRMQIPESPFPEAGLGW